MKHKINIRPGEVTTPRNIFESETKYKILVVSDKDLVSTLEAESKVGFEPLKWLDKVLPNAQSDFNGWKILMVKRK